MKYTPEAIKALKASVLGDIKSEDAIFAELLEDCNLEIMRRYRALRRENARLRQLLNLNGIDPDRTGR